jgi:hypothetical protein
MFINRVTFLCVLLTTLPAHALWKCVNNVSGSESFTDTPVYSETQSCEKVENIRFNKTQKTAPQGKKTASVKRSPAKKAKQTAKRSSKSGQVAANTQKAKRVVKRGKCPNAR